jgi:probable rRNA maturation factor
MMSDIATSRTQPPGEFAVSLSNQQSRHAVDQHQVLAAVRSVLSDSALTSAAVSVAVVDDATIHDLNRRYLDHDWPTDVLSFVLEERDGHLEGEVIVSADTAAASAREIGWPAAAELLLYAVHGTLHLIGYGDETTAEKRKMRAAEAAVLRWFGFEQPAPRSGKRPTARAAASRSRGGMQAK